MSAQWSAILADPASWFWWVGAGALLVIELMSGTFYLLMIAIGFAVAGVVRLLGAAVGSQVVIAALVAIFAVSIVRWIKRRKRRYQYQNDAPNALSNKPVASGGLDVGESVYVTDWFNGRARARYRGAEWDVALAEGVEETIGWYRIQRIEGICLILEL